MGATWTMYCREAMLGSLLTPDTYVPLTTLELALTRAIPVANAYAGQLLEPEAVEYHRAPYAAAGSHWIPTGFGEYTNTLPMTFPTVVTSWGLIVGWALVDPVSQQCLSVGSIQDPFVATAGMRPIIAPGVLLLGNYD